MTTNIQTKLSELQERNREKATRVTLSNGIDGYTFTPKALDTVTTDSFKAGALAVIGEIGEGLYSVNVDKEPSIQDEAWANQFESKVEAFWYGEAKGIENIKEYLTTLEATLKDPTPTPQDQNGHKINSDGSLCYDAKCRHCVRKDVIRE